MMVLQIKNNKNCSAMRLWDFLENIYESEQKLIYVHSKVPFSKLYVHYKDVNFHKCSEHFWSPSLLLFFSDSKKHTESPCNLKDAQIMPKICFSRVLELSIYAGGCKHSAEYPGDLRESFMLQGWTTSLGGKIKIRKWSECATFNVVFGGHLNIFYFLFHFLILKFFRIPESESEVFRWRC